MPRRISSASCVRNSLSSTTKSKQYLWVSDDLLAETFRNFTHRHRRYGSNVPGPLEARRRATKRKNTNLAHVDGGYSQIDPTVVLGTGPQHGWWQKTSAPVMKPAPSLFPFWLFKPPDPPPLKSSQGVLDLKDEDQDPLATDTMRDGKALEEDFRRQIKQCLKLRSVRHVIDSMQLNLRRSPELAEIAFLHVLSLYWTEAATTTAMVHEVLTDPYFNPPGSRNHLLLMQELCRNRVKRKTWDNVMFPAIQNALQLGLVGVEELQEMILLLPDLHKQCGLASIRDGEKLISDYHRLLTSIEDCKVLQLKDLSRDFVHKWYNQMARGNLHDNTITLLWRLRTFSGKSDIEVVAELIISKLQYLSQESLSATDKFKAWITALPEGLRGPAVLRTSQSLVASAIAGDLTIAEIERWYEMFSSLNTQTCSHVAIDQDAWDEALLSHDGLTAGQNLLALAWTVTYLTPDQHKSSQFLASFGVKDHFMKTSSNLGVGHNADLLGQVVMTLDMLPLPGKDRLYQHLQDFTDKSLLTMLGNHAYEDEVKLLLRSDLTKLTDEQFYRWAKINTNEALTDVAHLAAKNIDAFKVLARGLIMKNKSSFKIVNRVLEHNLSIKLALSQWPAHVEFQKLEYNGQFDLDPEKVTDLIHHLAISFAISPVIGPRSAFRSVYRLYLYLHRYGAPIRPLMARALWYAGVTRYGRDGTPTRQLEWCLSKVREIEGQETANMLLWSAGFRKARGEEMESYQSSAAQKPSLPTTLQNNHGLRQQYLKAAKHRSQGTNAHSKTYANHQDRQRPTSQPDNQAISRPIFKPWGS